MRTLRHQQSAPSKQCQKQQPSSSSQTHPISSHLFCSALLLCSSALLFCPPLLALLFFCSRLLRSGRLIPSGHSATRKQPVFRPTSSPDELPLSSAKQPRGALSLLSVATSSGQLICFTRIPPELSVGQRKARSEQKTVNSEKQKSEK